MPLSQQLRKQHQLFDNITDVLCWLSVIGIWPRYVESQTLKWNRKSLSLGLNPRRSPLKLLHISDLHLNQRLSKNYLNQVQKKITSCGADIIVFTGDFLCFGDCDDWDRLHFLLEQWKAPLGVYWVPGNHDYSHYITMEKGAAVCCQEPHPFLYRAIQKVFQTPPKEIKALSNHPPLEINQRLRTLLSSLDIELLDNKKKTILFQDTSFSLIGIEDLWARGAIPIGDEAKKLLASCGEKELKILLAHNPQSWNELSSTVSHLLVLSGHTHGGNVALPWLQQRLRNTSTGIPLSGWLEENNRSLLVSKGLGSPYPFRLFASPEAHLLEIS